MNNYILDFYRGIDDDSLTRLHNLFMNYLKGVEVNESERVAFYSSINYHLSLKETKAEEATNE